MTALDEGPGAVRGGVRWWLRLEGAAMFGLAVLFYPMYGYGWPVFFALFLVPDLSILGYLAGSRVGAATYNLAHNLVLPIVLAAFGHVPAGPWLVTIAGIWMAHIGFDRLLGLGLKYPTAFRHTHLGAVGRSHP